MTSLSLRSYHVDDVCDVSQIPGDKMVNLIDAGLEMRI